VLLRLGAICLRSVQCSTYNIRCLYVCRLRRGLGLCLPCSPSQRAPRVFRGWILLLRRRLILVVGSLLFRRFQSRSLLRTLGPGSLYLVGLDIPDILSISLACRRTILLRDVEASSLLLSSHRLLWLFVSPRDRMSHRGLGRACRLPGLRRPSRGAP